MLVEIKDEKYVKNLIEKGVAKEASPLIEYYKDELRCQLSILQNEYTFNVEEVVEALSYEWSDIDFDDVAAQIYKLAESYLRGE